MRRLLPVAALVLAGCMPQPNYITLVQYQPIAVEARRDDTTDEDLYASIIWFLGDVLPNAFRDEVTHVVKTPYEAVGVAKQKSAKGSRGAYASPYRSADLFHRLRIRAYEGQLQIEIDCVANVADELASLRTSPCGKERANGWPSRAAAAARIIVQDADWRAERRAARGGR
jgi:hypothetical protein